MINIYLLEKVPLKMRLGLITLMIDYHRETTPYAAHLVILSASVYRSTKSCYPQVLLENCKNKVIDKTIKRYMTEHLFDSCSDSNSNSD